MPKNETLRLFSRKKLYVRVFVGSLSPPYFFLNIIPFVGRIMLRSSPPFHRNSPLHNFFRNFFAKSFVVSIIFVTFAMSYPYWKLQMSKGGWTYTKALLNAWGLTTENFVSFSDCFI